MKALISKSKIRGRVSAPSSKSYTIRGLMCAALAEGKSGIMQPLSSDDTEASINVLSRVGIRIQRKKDWWQVIGGHFHEPDVDLFCGESAATLRFMTAICSLIPGKCQLTAGPSLSQRPVKLLIEALRQLGTNVYCEGETAPVMIDGGRLRGGVAKLAGNVSSQFISALLFIAPLADETVKIRLTTPLESKSFVLMTLDCMGKFGIKVEFSKDLREFEIEKQVYKPAKYRVEGDWSSASYFLALGALSGEVEVANLNWQSRQGDRLILEFLKNMGASVTAKDTSIKVIKSKLNAIRADLSDCIDLLPTMAVLAAVADGVSEFTGIERARLKESNRVSVLREGLERMGIKVVEERDRLAIIGSTPKGSVIDTKDDHRIAMSFGILGTVVGDMVIDNAECVSKTYPEFWEVLKSIGGEVEINGG